MIIFLSLKFFSLFLYGLIDWIFESFPIRNGGGLDGKEYVRNVGVVACVRLRTIEEEGFNFCYFGAYVLSK